MTEPSYLSRQNDFRRQFLADRHPGGNVRLSKSTSNLFRPRSRHRSRARRTEPLDRVIAIDAANRWADVEGMATYETIVDETLRHGLMPTVVPELKSITLGGAVAGVGIESSSFRYGLVHEAVLEMDILTGTGDVVLASPDNDHADLFYCLPNSYGTLGYALRVRVRLVPVQAVVALEHIPFSEAAAFFGELERICGAGTHDGETVDFVDGTVFDDGHHYITLGRFVADVPRLSDYTGRQIYYRSIPRLSKDYLTVHDYIWRWDTDWFWCSRAFGVQNPYVRTWIPRRYLRSTTYHSILRFEQRYGMAKKLGRLRRGPRHEAVIQDIPIPVEEAAAFLEFLHAEVGIKPIWICPTRKLDPSVQFPLFSMDPGRLYVNFGFWSGVELAPSEVEGDRNRRIEAKAEELGGKKSLYSTSYYDEDDFWRLYDGATYGALKKRYDPDATFTNLYEKCVRGS